MVLRKGFDGDEAVFGMASSDTERTRERERDG